MDNGAENSLWELLENFIDKLLNTFFHILNKEVPQGAASAILQFIKFGIVGVSNTLVSYFLYLISLLVFQKLNIFPNTDYLIAQVIAFVVSVLWSFYWNNKMVFQAEEERSFWKTLLKTYIAYSFTGLFLNSILLILWVQILHISEFLAPILNLIISVPLNFIINKFWAFK